MNNDIDIEETLRAKNKDIYLNKLNIDVDNNTEILLITVNNILNLLMEELKNKVINQSIKDKESLIIAEVDLFHKQLVEILQKIVNTRKSKLKDKVQSIFDIDYQEIVLKINEVFGKALDEKYHKATATFCTKLKDIDLNIEVSDYLDNYFYAKLLAKIQEILSNMSTILLNSYHEGQIKYQELNDKTLNRV